MTAETVVFQNNQYLSLPQIAETFGIKNPGFYQINDNGVIVGKGQIWGEYHVFMMLPVDGMNDTKEIY